ncbi:Nrap protein [Mucor lusitanicus]
MVLAAKRKYKKSLNSEPASKQAKKDPPLLGNTGYSEEEENGDWESNSDDSDNEDKLESTKIKTTKATEDDLISGELEGLKETAELYKSNIFKLEIDELLTEINVNYDKHKALQKALHHLKAIFRRHSRRKASQGGYGLKSIAKSKSAFNVDVAVEMPSSIFQEKDYANYRYHHKRACYLAVLAKAIQSANKKFNVEYSTMNGDARRPILLVKAAGDKSDVDFSKTKCVIRILPSVSADVFPIHRLAPGKSCVKPAEATPHYNASLLMDTSYTGNLAFLYQHSKPALNSKNAILLAPFSQCHIGFTPFVFAMLMAYLMQGNKDGTGKKLSASHSSYQLLRGTLDFIATHDFSTTPVFLGESDKSEFSAAEFQTHYDVAIVDPSGTLNLTATMTTSGTGEAFDEAAKADYYSYLPWFVTRMSDVLKRGLTNRVDLVAVQHTDANASWALNEKIQQQDQVAVTVGLLLNSDNAPRLVDQGPDSSNDEAVAEFRQFWGNKSELRRFKDGAIVESVVWQTQGYENRSLIVQKIVLYLLQLHLHVEASQLIYWAGQLYGYLNLSKHVPENLFSPELKTSGFHPVMQAYQQFSKQLRQVDDALPLLINNVYPAHASLRYASVTLPHPVDFNNMVQYPTTTRYFDAIDVVVQIERSAKFPDDLAVLQKVKHAFYLKMSEELKTRFDVDSVVVDNVREKNPLAIRGYLDVYYFGYLFRCHICLEQEATLLEKIVDAKTTTKLNKALATEALDKYKYQLRYKQTHTFYVQAMCAKYTAYSSTVRLAKRWFGAHLLSPHVSDEMVELLVAHVFLESQPWVAPVSTFAAFARVLGLLATWDWQNTPLIVDIEGELTTKDREEIVSQFNQHRRTNPQMSVGAMTIATAKDHSGHRWTTKKPARAIAARIQALARASVQVMEEATSSQDIKRVFVTPMQDYPVVLDLDIEHCTRYYQNMHPEARYLKPSYGVAELGDKPYAQFDPVQDFIADIEQVYGNTVMYGALVWNPTVATPMQWKVNAGYNSVPNGFLKPAKGQSDISKFIAPNFAAILAEIERLGRDGILKQQQQE